MEFPPEIYELIEQYLNGQLQGAALQSFEKRLKEDTEFAKEVAFQREMHNLLAETPENDLRKTLQMLGDQFVEPKEEEDKGWFWWLWPATGETNVLDWLFGHPARHLAWVVPLLLIAGWWQFNRNGLDIEDPPIVRTDTLDYNKRIERVDTMETLASDPDPLPPIKDTIEAPRPIIPKGTLEKNPTPFVKQDRKINPAKAEVPQIVPYVESAPTIGDDMASIPDSDGPPKTYPFFEPPTIYWDADLEKIAAKYFDANIYFGPSNELDSLVKATQQSEDYKINILTSPEVIYLVENTYRSDTLTQKVPLKLVIETDRNLFEQDLVLYVKDNLGNPYGPFPLLDSLQWEEENRYIVQTQIPLWDNTPRLVYYTIENYETKTSYFADKVVVLPKDSLFKIEDFPFKGSIINLADLSHRLFDPDAIPDFFEPNTKFETAIDNNPQSADFKIIIQPAIPDTIRIADSLLTYDTTLSDAAQAIRSAYLDSIFTRQLIVHSSENLFQEGLSYTTSDNLNYQITQNYDNGFGIKKKYSANVYFLDFIIGYDSDYPEGLYYYQISAGSKTFTGKYIVLPIATEN